MVFGKRSNQENKPDEKGQTTEPGLRAGLRAAWPRVWPLLAIGLALRVLFLLVGAKIYYAGRQDDIHTNGDTYSYILSFYNLLHHGRYTFDLTEADAGVGRLPGYPFFYGLHYLIFGESRALFATACTQVLLDTAGIWLIYVITARLSSQGSWAPLVAALLLAFYPFAIVWIPVVSTESLGVFLVLLWWAALLLSRPRPLSWVLLGMLLAVIIYVREFLGVCLAVTLLYWLVGAIKSSGTAGWQRPTTWLLVGFLALYIWWPMRNYLTLGRFIPLKPAAAGYANLREDAQAALAWMLTWTNDVTMGFDEIMVAENPTFPAEVISTPAEKQLMDSLIVLSRSCASSFHVRAQVKVPDSPTTVYADYAAQYQKAQRVNTLQHHNCNAVVSAGYNRLRASYLHRHPIRGRVEVPLMNLQKILFKNQFKTAAGEQLTLAQRLSSALFTWRSILLALGLVGVWRYRRVAGLWPGVVFTIIIFGYMAVIFRSMEMRYLLQADVLMLVPTALLVAGWLPRRTNQPVGTAATGLSV